MNQFDYSRNPIKSRVKCTSPPKSRVKKVKIKTPCKAVARGVGGGAIDVVFVA